MLAAEIFDCKAGLAFPAILTVRKGASIIAHLVQAWDDRKRMKGSRMGSPRKQTESIRQRKRVAQGKKRKRLLRRKGSTPKLAKLLSIEPDSNANTSD